jgi:hypothetical protein
MNQDENNKLMIIVLNAFFNITLKIDENVKFVLNGGIIPLLILFVNS